MKQQDLDTLLALSLERLKKYVFRRVDNPVEAEEIVQETLISALDAFPNFKGYSSFFTWLAGIANHEISDFYRKKKIKTFLFSRLPWLEDLVSEALGPEQLLLKKEFEEKVRRTLISLNEGYREVLRLKYYQGLTVKEIALKLSESQKAIESRLTRARQAFARTYAASDAAFAETYTSNAC